MKPEGIIKVEIIHNIKNPDKSLIKTNIRKGMVSGILGEWINSQIGCGEDKRETKEKGAYQIDIELDLSDDTFYTTSNTGNTGLTAGIILKTFGRLNEIKIINS